MSRLGSLANSRQLCARDLPAIALIAVGPSFARVLHDACEAAAFSPRVFRPPTEKRMGFLTWRNPTSLSAALGAFGASDERSIVGQKSIRAGVHHSSARTSGLSDLPNSTSSNAGTFAWAFPKIRSMQNSKTTYDERYSRPGYYWGTKPTGLCRSVVKIIERHRAVGFRLIDLGAGEGRDLVHFARHGLRVLGVDISSVGLEKARRRAAKLNLRVRTQIGDIRVFRIPGKFDVVFASGALGNLPPSNRSRRFEHFKRATVRGGINAMNAFVKKPYLRPPPEMDRNEMPYRSGELLGYYWDWQILESGEIEFGCNSSGIPHRHAMDIVIARKPS